MEQRLVIASVVCPACGQSVAALETRCGSCGSELASAPRVNLPRQATATATLAPAGASIIDQRGPLLLLLFGAMGVLGLPLLWYSRAFGPLAKLLIGALVTVWTAALAALVLWSWMWMFERLSQVG